MAQLPDIDQIDRARKGDGRAMEQVLAGMQPVLRSFFISRIGAGPDVDDLVQNTLLRMHRGLSDLKDASSLKAFAMKGAIFELQDFYRGRYSIKERLYEPGTLPEHDAEQPSEAEAVDVDRILSALTPHARRILELRAYGFRYEEIAEMVDSTEAAVKMQVKRALDKLKALFLLLITCGIVAWGVAR